MARLLIAVDGSDHARQAARRATELLGSENQATVMLVVQPPSLALGAMPAESTIPPPPVLDDAAADAAFQAARHEVDHVIGLLGIDATPRVEWGEPGWTICQVAADEGFDVVVVGSHGSGFLKRMLMGSVGHHVLHHAPCPVLFVRPGSETPRTVERNEEQEHAQ